MKLIIILFLSIVFLTLVGCDAANMDSETTASIDDKFISFKDEARFKEQFKEVAIEYFQKAQTRENHPIISFGIFTDCDISGFIFQYNTAEGIQKNIDWTLQQQKEHPSMFQDAKLDGTPWSIPEWIASEKEAVINQDDDSRIRACFDMMYYFDEANKGDGFVAYKDKMFDLFCVCLSELKAEGIFKGTADNFVLLVQECDNGLYDTRAESLSKILNPTQLQTYTEFCDDYYSFE